MTEKDFGEFCNVVQVHSKHRLRYKFILATQTKFNINLREIGGKW